MSTSPAVSGAPRTSTPAAPSGSPPAGSLDDAVTIWAVQRLALLSLPMRVHTFLGLTIATAAFVTAGAGVSAFLAVSAAHAALVTAGAPPSRAAWSAALAVLGTVTYLGVGAVLRESFSRVRYAVPASPVRGLWLALDTPLRHVVAVERGVEHLAHVLVGGALTVGAGAALASHGHVGPAAVALVGIALPVAGGAWAQVAALRNAAGTAARRTVTWLWDAYLAVAGLAVGVLGHRLVQAERGAEPPAGVALPAAPVVAAIAGGLAIAGWVTVVAGVRRVRRLRRADAEVPLLGLDDPALLADRVTLWPRRRRATSFAAAAVGTGALTVHPMVRVVGRVVLAATALSTGAWLGAGPPVRGLALGSLAADDAVLRGMPVLAAVLAGQVCVVTVMAAGHEQRLWHYRALWELGSHPARLWAAHLTGSLVQASALTALAAVGSAALTGRVQPVLVGVGLVVVLAEHLSESALARPGSTDGDHRAVSYAPALLATALVAPGVLAAVGGPGWSWFVPVHVALLALGGLWCFTHRLTSLPLGTE